MPKPLRCACCDKVESFEGFVTVAASATIDGFHFDAGDVLRIECARRLGATIPPRQWHRFIVKPM